MGQQVCRHQFEPGVERAAGAWIDLELEIKTCSIGLDPELGQGVEASGIDAEIADHRQVGAWGQIGVADGNRDGAALATGEGDRHHGAHPGGPRGLRDIANHQAEGGRHRRAAG